VNAVGFFGMSTDVHHPPGTYPNPLGTIGNSVRWRA
jgi:hypothetical protein